VSVPSSPFLGGRPEAAGWSARARAVSLSTAKPPVGSLWSRWHAVEPAGRGLRFHRSAASGPPPAAGADVVALIGAPNSGKSTLFNALTGGRRTVGDWPGTTVEVGSASWSVAGTAVELLDLPGTYSLDPQSPDEQLTRDLLIDGAPDRRPAVTVVVADASHLARSLYSSLSCGKRLGGSSSR
jgi:Ferrous iron transport protein B